MAATDLRNPLAQRILRVENETAAAFRNHPAVGFGVHFRGQNLLYIKGEQLQSVRIDAPQIGGDQGLGGGGGTAGGHTRGTKYIAGKTAKNWRREGWHEPLEYQPRRRPAVPLGTFATALVSTSFARP
jgi:hypothetical protein